MRTPSKLIELDVYLIHYTNREIISKDKSVCIPATSIEEAVGTFKDFMAENKESDSYVQIKNVELVASKMLLSGPIMFATQDADGESPTQLATKMTHHVGRLHRLTHTIIDDIAEQFGLESSLLTMIIERISSAKDIDDIFADIDKYKFDLKRYNLQHVSKDSEETQTPVETKAEEADEVQDKKPKKKKAKKKKAKKKKAEESTSDKNLERAGNEFKKARNKIGISQKEAGKAIGLSQTQVSQIENGQSEKLLNEYGPVLMKHLDSLSEDGIWSNLELENIVN